MEGVEGATGAEVEPLLLSPPPQPRRYNNKRSGRHPENRLSKGLRETFDAGRKKSSISSPCLKLNRNRVVGPISDLNTQTLRRRVCKVYVYLEKRFTVTNRCPILGLSTRLQDFPAQPQGD